MIELIHMTATYSNAVLVAILPHVSDFAKKLDLPIPQPITAAQVLRCNVSPEKGRIEGSVVLTNHYWFMFENQGYVGGFTSPTNWFSDGENFIDNLPRYVGQTRMTTNEIIGLARESLLKLGYNPALTRSDTPPQLEGPSTLKTGEHIAYCQVTWRLEENADSPNYSWVKVDINTQEKSVVGMYLAFARTNHVGTPLKVDVEPELESDFRKRTKANMFIRTNAPPYISQTNLPAKIKSSDD